MEIYIRLSPIKKKKVTKQFWLTVEGLSLDEQVKVQTVRILPKTLADRAAIKMALIILNQRDTNTCKHFFLCFEKLFCVWHHFPSTSQ